MIPADVVQVFRIGLRFLCLVIRWSAYLARATFNTINSPALLKLGRNILPSRVINDYISLEPQRVRSLLSLGSSSLKTLST
jgi:hypothetical protein